MEKVELRDKLFKMHFEDNDGVLASSLVDSLSFIPDTWKKLHELCEENIRYFDKFSYLGKINSVEHKGKKYLILKLRLFRYIVIDLETMKCLSEAEVHSLFDEEFFKKNLDEIDSPRGMDMYIIDNFSDVSSLVEFYAENSVVLSLPYKINCRHELGDAWTYFSLDLINGGGQLGFQTPDQFLYEQLFLNFDLSPSNMQDAQNKIGLDKMREMFAEIKNIKIPKSCIPRELYEIYLASNSKKQKVKTDDKKG